MLKDKTSEGKIKGDAVIWSVFFFLCIISIIEVFSASSHLSFKSGDYLAPVLYHCLLLAVGVVVMICTMNIPCRYFKLVTPLALFASVLMLVIVFFVGETTNGSQRWLDIFGIQFQPSEIAKGTMVLATAQILSARQTPAGADKRAFKEILLLCVLIVPLILVENLSTAVLLCTVIFLMMFIGKVPKVQLGRLLGVVALSIAVLVTAVMGVNVFVVLVGGIFLAGAIGLWYGALAPLSFAQAIYKGFLSMSDIFLLSLFTGGLAEMVSRAGGIAFLLDRVQRFIHGKNSAELGISALVSITDIALANNTVAIIINGEVAKGICYTFRVDPRRSAALLSTFSSIFQGLIPYGAQMLIVTSFAAGRVSPLEVIPYAWFIYLLAISAIVSVFIPFSDGFIKKDPWNFETGKPQSKSAL